MTRAYTHTEKQHPRFESVGWLFTGSVLGIASERRCGKHAQLKGQSFKVELQPACGSRREVHIYKQVTGKKGTGDKPGKHRVIISHRSIM